MGTPRISNHSNKAVKEVNEGLDRPHQPVHSSRTRKRLFLHSQWYLSDNSPSRARPSRSGVSATTEIPETTCSTVEAVGTSVISKTVDENDLLVDLTEIGGNGMETVGKQDVSIENGTTNLVIGITEEKGEKDTSLPKGNQHVGKTGQTRGRPLNPNARNQDTTIFMFSAQTSTDASSVGEDISLTSVLKDPS